MRWPVFRHASHLLFLIIPYTSHGQTSIPAQPLLLDLPASVRSAGLHGAGVALVGDAGSVFANPAGLATIGHISVEGAYRSARENAAVATGAVAWRLRQFDVGFGVRRFDLGSNPARFFGAGVGGGEAQEQIAVGSLVYRFGLLALGASGKYVRQRAAQIEQRGASADVGLAIAFFDIMALAFSVQNVRGNWNSSSPIVMPRRTRLGFTMNYVDPQEAFRLLSTAEIRWHEAARSRVVLGGEAGIVLHGVGVIGRAGYAGSEDATGRSQFTFGATLTVGHLDIDYAFQATDVFGVSTHQLGVRLTL